MVEKSQPTVSAASTVHQGKGPTLVWAAPSSQGDAKDSGYRTTPLHPPFGGLPESHMALKSLFLLLRPKQLLSPS